MASEKEKESVIGIIKDFKDTELTNDRYFFKEKNKINVVSLII